MSPAEDEDNLIVAYLIRVSNAARHLPPATRDRIVAEMTDQIYARLEAETVGAAAVVAGLGDPRDVVRAADGVPRGTGCGWMEYLAVVLLLIGAILWIGLVPIGLVLLWGSSRWQWQDKLMGTVVWPAGLLIARLLLVHYQLS
jgi:hypothetical protein